MRQMVIAGLSLIVVVDVSSNQVIRIGSASIGIQPEAFQAG